MKRPVLFTLVFSCLLHYSANRSHAQHVTIRLLTTYGSAGSFADEASIGMRILSPDWLMDIGGNLCDYQRLENVLDSLSKKSKERVSSIHLFVERGQPLRPLVVLLAVGRIAMNCSQARRTVVFVHLEELFLPQSVWETVRPR
jgi:hypothetical protein